MNRGHLAATDEKWKAWYRALKATNPQAYIKAIQYSESLSINQRFDTEVAAEVEVSHVILACELLEVYP